MNVKRWVHRGVLLIKYLFLAAWVFFCGNRKKVLFITQFTEYTGTHIYFKMMMEYFLQRNFIITVVSDSRNRAFIEQYLNNPSVTFTAIPAGAEKNELFINMKSRQVFHFFDKIFPSVLFFLKIIRRKKIGKVFISSQFPGDYFSLFLIPVQKFYVVHALLWARLDEGSRHLLEIGKHLKLQFITVSEVAKVYIQKFWEVRLNKVTVIPNYYVSEQGFLHSSLNCKSELVRILSIGYLDKNKNPLLFVDIAKEILEEYPGKLIFTWAGDGPLLEECFGKSASIKGLEFIGATVDIDKLYQTSCVYTQLSHQESQGMAILGAMYYGLPCVVTKSGGPEDSISDGVNGFICEVNAKKCIKQRILQLVQSVELRETMGKEARRDYLMNFSKTSWTKKMDAILE